MHGAGNYPWKTKTRSNYDVGLPDNTGDDEYLSTLTEWLPHLIELHDPSLIFFQVDVRLSHIRKFSFYLHWWKPIKWAIPVVHIWGQVACHRERLLPQFINNILVALICLPRLVWKKKFGCVSFRPRIGRMFYVLLANAGGRGCSSGRQLWPTIYDKVASPIYPLLSLRGLRPQNLSKLVKYWGKEGPYYVVVSSQILSQIFKHGICAHLVTDTLETWRPVASDGSLLQPGDEYKLPINLEDEYSLWSCLLPFPAYKRRLRWDDQHQISLLLQARSFKT